MPSSISSKRTQNTERTRDKMISAALALYAERSIDAVSLREIAVAAGQKNSNALQYHFGDRHGLLQAIVERHAAAITASREASIAGIRVGELTPARAAARGMVLPIVHYLESHPEGVQFVRVVSQMAAIYQSGRAPEAGAPVRFPDNPALVALFDSALAHLPPREVQRRIYLVVVNTFHSLADIYRAEGDRRAGDPIASRRLMVEQLLLMLEAYLSAAAAPSR